MTIPVATYRLQLTPEFGFREAAAVVGYLRDLGVSHVYVSPIFEAVPGSTHGYDQTDPTRLRAELGGEEGFAALSDAVERQGLRVLLDIVPNHAAAHHENPWWWRMLREGRESASAKFFDVDWRKGRDKVVLPVLGSSLEEAAESGMLRIEPAREGAIRYGEQLFPIATGTWNGDAGLSAAELVRLLDAQHYRLREWRTARNEINYRRFFDINGLAGVRVEDAEVFEATHATVFRLVKEGRIHGLRIDHIDGLRDPLGYLKRLRAWLDELGPSGADAFIVVEKILGHGETLPESWPVSGTTGYEFAVQATAMGINRNGVEQIRAWCVREAPGSFAETLVRSKTEVAASHFEPEVERVWEAVEAAAAAAGVGVDAGGYRRAITALALHLDVYRTYIDDEAPSSADVERLGAAAGRAKETSTPKDADAIDQVVSVFLRKGPYAAAAAHSAAVDAVARWQQLTGPLAAKGGEDTALYRDNSFPALNEVGGDPGRLPSVDDVEQLLLSRRRHPGSLNATATHDTKRGEDTRYRIAALSRHPKEVCEFLASVERAIGKLVGNQASWLLGFTLLALEPLENSEQEKSRVRDYMRKVGREAKVHTNWTEPNGEYEAAMDAAVNELMSLSDEHEVRQGIRSLSRRTRSHAFRHGVFAVVLKTLSVGVPDFYQGSEFLDLSLVDPDNRRPVDWAARRTALTEMKGWLRTETPALMPEMKDSDWNRRKMFVTWRALAIRRWLLVGGAGVDIKATGDMWGKGWTVTCRGRQAIISIGGMDGVISNAVDQLRGLHLGDTEPVQVVLRDVDGGEWVENLVR